MTKDCKYDFDFIQFPWTEMYSGKIETTFHNIITKQLHTVIYTKKDLSLGKFPNNHK